MDSIYILNVRKKTLLCLFRVDLGTYKSHTRLDEGTGEKIMMNREGGRKMLERVAITTSTNL